MIGCISIQILQPPFQGLVGRQPTNLETRPTSPTCLSASRRQAWPFTRAIRDLYLPPDFKDILTPEWQAAIKRYEPIQGPKSSHAPQPRRAKGAFSGFSVPRSGPLISETPQPQEPREKPFKVGDRVRTSHGIGTVVETDGEKYFVFLDGQVAQLWEKECGLSKE